MHVPSPGDRLEVDGAITRVAGVARAIGGKVGIGSSLHKTEVTVLGICDISIVGLNSHRPIVAEHGGWSAVIAVNQRHVLERVGWEGGPSSIIEGSTGRRTFDQRWVGP